VQPIASLARTLTIAAIAAVLLAAGVVAFAAGYLDQMQRAAVAPQAGPAGAVKALNDLESALGYGGFLAAHQRVRDDPAAAQDMAKHLAAARSALARLNGIGADGLREIRGILGAYDAALQSAQAGYPTPNTLDAPYASLRMEAARLRQGALAARIDALAGITAWAQWAALSALGLLAIGFLVMAWLLSGRVSAPLNQLRASMTAMGRDPAAGAVWGTDRKDEIGAVARAAEKLRKALVETPVLPNVGPGQTLKIKLDGPSGALFERLVQDIAQAAAQIEAAGGAGREQLAAAAQRLSATAADLSGFAHGARAEVREAVSGIGGTAGAVQERLQASLDGVAAASESLRAAAQDARNNQAAVTQFTQSASGQTTEAVALLQGAGQTLGQALAAMETRMSEALSSVSALTERLGASAAALNISAEESARRLASAAKDMEGRSKEAELRLGLALDQAGQQARAQAQESAALKTALAQALDDIRQARSGLEAAHGAPGTDIGPILSAVQDLQSLLVQRAASPGDTAPDSLERTGMAAAKPLKPTGPARLPIAAADMLARLGSIAAEVRAAAGHDLTGLRGISEDLADALSAPAPSTDWASFAAALEAEAGQLSADLAPIHASAARAVEALRAGGAGKPSGRAALAQHVALLLADIAAADAFAPPPLPSTPQSAADALDAAAQDLQRIGELLADLELRAETLAQSSALGVPEGPDGIVTADAARADQKANEAIVAVMESIERLNNIAGALSRAGDFQAQRKAGE
jgi:hypothetical protein